MGTNKLKYKQFHQTVICDFAAKWFIELNVNK